MMAAYGFLDVLTSFCVFVCLVWSFVTHTLYWEPLFEKVRDSGRAGIAHPQRARLAPVIWLLAIAVYFHNVFVLWDLMTLALEKGALGRLIYLIMDVYLIFLILCGIAGLALTGRFMHHNRQELVDLFVIAKFSTSDYRRLVDLERQATSSNNAEEAPPRAKASARPSHSIYNYNLRRMMRVPLELRNEYVRRREETIAIQDAKVRARMEEINSRVEAKKKQAKAAAESSRASSSNSFHGFDCETTREEDIQARLRGIKAHVARFMASADAQTDSNASSNIDSNDDSIHPTSSSSASPPTKTNRKRRRRHSDLDTENDVSDLESCSSCCSARTKSLQSTRPAKHREPLTPTSPSAPTGPYVSDADAEMTDALRTLNLDPTREQNCGRCVRRYEEEFRSYLPTMKRRFELVNQSEHARPIRASLRDTYRDVPLPERLLPTGCDEADIEDELDISSSEVPSIFSNPKLRAELMHFSKQPVREPRRTTRVSNDTQSSPTQQDESKNLNDKPPQQTPAALQPAIAPFSDPPPLMQPRLQSMLVDQGRLQAQAADERTLTNHNSSQYPRPMRAMTPLTITIPPLTLPNPAVGASIPPLTLANPDPPSPMGPTIP